MPKIQYAQQQEPAPTSESLPTVAKPEQLSLPELIRIMDVATELRKGQELVEEQLNFDQIKLRLRERLLDAAKVSGEAITAEQIDAAIEEYYDKLYEYEDPPWSFRRMLAELYAHRVTIVKWAVAIVAVAGLLWLF